MSKKALKLSILILLPILSIYQPDTFANNIRGNNMDSSKVFFGGLPNKVTYRNGRKISEAYFELKNYTKEKKTVKLIEVYLKGANSDVRLQRGEFIIFLNGKYIKCTEFEMRSSAKMKLKVTFKPFKFYPGYKYSIKAVILVDNERMIAVTDLPVRKTKRKDKNLLKDE